MSSYAVKKFKVGKVGSVGADLADFLSELATDGWNVVSVVPGLDVKGAGFLGNRPDSFLVVVARPSE